MISDSDPAKSTFATNESATCDRCGRFGALEVNGQHLCEECFALCGSCCAEFEADAPQTPGTETGAAMK